MTDKINQDTAQTTLTIGLFNVVEREIYVPDYSAEDSEGEYVTEITYEDTGFSTPLSSNANYNLEDKNNELAISMYSEAENGAKLIAYNDIASNNEQTLMIKASGESASFEQLGFSNVYEIKSLLSNLQGVDKNGVSDLVSFLQNTKRSSNYISLPSKEHEYIFEFLMTSSEIGDLPQPDKTMKALQIALMQKLAPTAGIEDAANAYRIILARTFDKEAKEVFENRLSFNKGGYNFPVKIDSLGAEYRSDVFAGVKNIMQLDGSNEDNLPEDNLPEDGEEVKVVEAAIIVSMDTGLSAFAIPFNENFKKEDWLDHLKSISAEGITLTGEDVRAKLEFAPDSLNSQVLSAEFDDAFRNTMLEMLIYSPTEPSVTDASFEDAPIDTAVDTATDNTHSNSGVFGMDS